MCPRYPYPKTTKYKNRFKSNNKRFKSILKYIIYIYLINGKTYQLLPIELVES